MPRGCSGVEARWPDRFAQVQPEHLHSQLLQSSGTGLGCNRLQFGRAASGKLSPPPCNKGEAGLQQ